MTVDGVVFRRARAGDLAALVALLRDDELGAAREGDGPTDDYATAFADIDADPRHELVVGESDGQVVAALQLTILPSLTFQGRPRAQVEGVRVASGRRSQGLGEALMAHVSARARHHGCRVVQLTTDKRRPDSLRFYERLGFVATHEGMKLELEPDAGATAPVPTAWSVRVVGVLAVDRRVVVVAAGPDSWSLPGARLDDGDASPEDALVEACRDQLGVEVEVGELIATTVDGGPPGRALVVAYRCHVAADAPADGWPPQGGGVGLFTHDELADLDIPVDHVSFITQGL